MKRFFTYATLAVAALSLVFSSCSDTEDPAKPLKVDLTQTATIKGKVLVREDENSSTPRWIAPAAGTVSFFVTVPYSNLNSASAEGVYLISNDDVTYSATTGEFSIEAPVSVQGSEVTVKMNEFGGTIRRTGGKDVKVIWKTKTAKSSKVYPEDVHTLPEWKLSGAAGDYTVITNNGDEI